MKTTAFPDCRRFAASVAAAGGKLPQTLQNLIQAHDVLADATALPAAAQRPESTIFDAALDGSLTRERLGELLPAAASAAAVYEYAKTLAGSVERVLLGAWHREMESGGADAILSSMRPLFDKHAKEIAKARSLFNAESSAEAILASGVPEVVTAWGDLNDHLTVIAKIAVVAREFGPRLGSCPQIREFAGGDGFLLADEALMCADGNLVLDSSYFLRPDGPHRASALFQVRLKLHSVDSARARYTQWAADQWDASNVGRPRGGRLIDGEMVEDPLPPNPFRQQEEANA
jgi:hypothetical protein